MQLYLSIAINIMAAPNEKSAIKYLPHLKSQKGPTTKDLRPKLLDPLDQQGSVVRHMLPVPHSHPLNILGKIDLVVIIRIDALKDAFGHEAGVMRSFLPLFHRCQRKRAFFSRTWAVGAAA